MVHLEDYLSKGNEGECEEQLVSVSLICNQRWAVTHNLITFFK